LRRLTVPEGYTIQQIDSLAAEAGLLKPGVLFAAATDAEFVRKQGIEAETLEGYLFPDTYHFPKGVTAETLIQTMLDHFYSVFSGDWKERAEALDLSIHEVVTLASIIEKETGVPEERPLIASVFHNRLKRKMRLQSDPTVIYGAENYEGDLTRQHLDTATPYNTYRTAGLPPGPIANPGEASLRATLFPAESNYLYFVSRGDSTHQFSTNLADHNRAVRKYQLGKRSRK
ncbi:MAG: endolytic transglycosylase MltG, partial [Thermodesulfobacteriota bacterium]